MAGHACTWAFVLAVIAGQVSDAHGSVLRKRGLDRQAQGKTLHAGSLSDVEQHRAAVLKTIPPFEINPGTFLGLVAAVPTDTLLLFFSPTCPDCEQLMPLWTRVAGMFEDNQDLTILSVSDDAGRAPAPYTHDENPAIFFIPRGDSAHPITFPMSDLHEFVALPETGQTDDNIVNKLVAFSRSHLTGASRAVAPVPAPVVQTPTAPQALSESQAGALTARLLASLKAKESAPIEEQLKIVNEPHYQTLPVVEFLKTPMGVGPPLVTVAATYLDGLPMANQWAQQYAAQEEAAYRSRGWNPTPEQEQSYFQDLLNYATPLYARSIYVQRGLRA